MSLSTFIAHSEKKAKSKEPNPSEREFLQLLSNGYKTTEITEIMHMPITAVNNMRLRVFKKLSVKNSPHAVAYALRKKLIQ